MTAKEAIDGIKKLRTFHNGSYAKAIDMAIEALESQPEHLVKESGDLVKDLVNDTISRNDAIDAVKRNTFRLTLAEEQNGEGHVVWSAEAVYSDVMEDELLELPSAQAERQKGHWIFDFAHNEMTCSECGRTFTGGFDLENADNFCRHCGSDMRGEQDDKQRSDKLAD